MPTQPREQGDLFHVEQSGKALKEQALDRFEERETEWLPRVRAVMAALIVKTGRDVSADDVWKFCPPPADAHPSVMGAVFRPRAFLMTGWTTSKRTPAHARSIRTYTLR